EALPTPAFTLILRFDAKPKTEDWIVETHINNLSEGATDVIYGQLRDVGFLYVARMLGGTKLDPPLINALVKIWRMDTHTFHPPNGECTITLKDVSLHNSVYQLMGKSLWDQWRGPIRVQHASNY
ncbi:hypothetical protein Golob_021617, partial [Gossypium lobatum]|nr:hypothetical protein [Gossypium lobatum]